MQDEPVRLGVVGAGFMGQVAHLRNFDRIDGCDIVALAEPRDDLAARVAKRYEIDHIYSDHEALVASADVDAFVAVQPYATHRYILPALLEAGVPLFTEKPLALRPETGEALVELGADHGVTHMIGYHKRSDPAMVYARECIREWNRSGACGELRYVRITMPPGDWIANAPDPISTGESPPTNMREDPPNEFDTPTGRAYDEFVNYYIHQVNALRFLFDAPYEVVFGNERILCAECESGASGVIELAPFTTEETWEESIMVGFDRGHIDIELPPPLVSQAAGTVTIQQRRDGTDELRQPAMPDRSAMYAQAEHFVDVVRGEREPPCDAREALEDLYVARSYIRRVHG